MFWEASKKASTMFIKTQNVIFLATFTRWKRETGFPTPQQRPFLRNVARRVRARRVRTAWDAWCAAVEAAAAAAAAAVRAVEVARLAEVSRSPVCAIPLLRALVQPGSLES